MLTAGYVVLYEAKTIEDLINGLRDFNVFGCYRVVGPVSTSPTYPQKYLIESDQYLGSIQLYKNTTLFIIARAKDFLRKLGKLEKIVNNKTTLEVLNTPYDLDGLKLKGVAIYLYTNNKKPAGELLLVPKEDKLDIYSSNSFWIRLMLSRNAFAFVDPSLKKELIGEMGLEQKQIPCNIFIYSRNNNPKIVETHDEQELLRLVSKYFGIGVSAKTDEIKIYERI